MIGILAKVFTAVFSRFFYAFFTEKLLSMVIIELLDMLSRKTTNKLDDAIVAELAENMKR